MQLAQVRYFVESARLLNFTRAAGACGVSQPALSRGIKALEHELAGPLLHRTPTVALTDLGRRVLPFMQQIDDAARMAKLQAAGISDGAVVPIAIGFDSSVSPSLFERWIGDLHRLFNGLSLRLESAEVEPLRKRLIDGDIDLLVCGHHGGAEAGPLHRICLATEDCVVLYPPDHPFMGDGPIEGARLLHAPDRIRFCETVEVLLRNLGPLTPPRHQASSADHFAQLVDARLGWGLLPESHPLTVGRNTRPVCEPPIQRVVELVYVAGRQHTKGVATLIRIARTQVLKGRLGDSAVQA
jgi:DNA-binding transcriptional LysR family regulator